MSAKQPSPEQRAALFKAVTAGDIAALEGFFQHEGIQAAVAATDQYIRRHKPSDVRYSPQAQDVTYPWYCMPMPTMYQRRHALTTAVLQNQFEVVAWFVSDERIAIMRATLAFMWPHMAAIAMNSKHAEILELLLGASESLFPDRDQCQKVVNGLICGADVLHSDMVRIAIAHGAEVHTTAALKRCAGFGTGELADMFMDEGAFVVGADVLARASCIGRWEASRRLMQFGADFGNRSEVLHTAALEGHRKMVGLYVNDGFMDIDARDTQGRTALMRLVCEEQLAWRWSIKELAEIATILLTAGADTTLKDHQGLTALELAKMNEFTAVVEILEKQIAKEEVCGEDRTQAPSSSVRAANSA